MPLALSGTAQPTYWGFRARMDAEHPKSQPHSCWDRPQQSWACFPYTQGPDAPGISLIWVPKASPLSGHLYLAEIRKA